MSAHKYAVSFDPSINVPSRNGVKSAVVVAESVADAKALLKAQHADDVVGGWDNATFTEMAAGADLSGWSLRVQINLDSLTGASVVGVTVTGDDTNNTVDEIAALMVTALNATAPIAGAAYDASTNVLKVAETTDNLGDHRLYVFMTPPGSSVPIPGFVGAIADRDNANTALTAALAADAYTVPKISGQFADVSGA